MVIKRKRNLIFFSIVFLTTIADQLSKLWIRTHIISGQSLPETGFFRLTHGQNTGAIFGIFQGNNNTLTILVIIVTVSILTYFFFVRDRYPFLNTRLNTIASGLILGGMVGNLIDRIHLGYVTDFISIGSWPDFNLADSSGVVGVIIFTFSILPIFRNTSFKDH
ncbi:signal peptidase II [Chloroflexota bacterium]